MSKKEPILFYGHTEGKYQSFSNFYPSPFTDENGNAFVCTEQWLMYNKAITFNDSAMARLIMQATEPRKMKKYGRQVKGYDEAVWSAAREDVMYRGLLLKFRQNPDIRDVLLSTGSRPIAEASPSDKIFGIGAPATNPRAQDPDNWPSMGQNVLGRMLMKCRDTIRAEMA